ncbi:MerR family DNA-binding protein [Pikeienuella piscinae]|uniref:MerR family DNA-binding protein n=1 Tax=Pikeienuella piscinae TaxID=2748098 RepID=A0A7M3T702_9RHOB|nr:MerR family DNA-binding protein [Pikeienuella piscinae]
MFPIGQASARSGVGIETIRYYERRGVVGAPGRSAAGRRLYSNDEIARLRFVKRCRALGFSIPTIRIFLSMTPDRGQSCAEVKAMAGDHLREIDRRIESLTTLRSALRRLSESCDAGETNCPMLDELMSDDADARAGETA